MSELNTQNSRGVSWLQVVVSEGYRDLRSGAVHGCHELCHGSSPPHSQSYLYTQTILSPTYISLPWHRLDVPLFTRDELDAQRTSDISCPPGLANMSDPEPVLNYRPPKPKVTRQKISPCRCLAYTCLASGIALGCAVTWFLGNAAIGAVDSIRHPHRAHHYNGTQYGIDGDQSVVHPILGNDTKFDVAATLWYSLPREDRADVGEIEASEASEEEKVMMRYWGAPPKELQPIPKQEALLSEIIFRNASFKDKNVHRRLQYKLPLDRL